MATKKCPAKHFWRGIEKREMVIASGDWGWIGTVDGPFDAHIELGHRAVQCVNRSTQSGEVSLTVAGF